MGGILGIALSLIPGLASLANGPLGKVLAGIAEGAAHKVFGTTDPEQIKAQMAADAGKVEAFKAELEAGTEQLRIMHEENSDMRAKQVEDISGARTQLKKLGESGSKIAWGAPIVSLVIVFCFFSTTMMLFFLKQDLPEKVFQLLYLAFGAEIPMCTQVVNFWLGSSFSSQKKDDTIAVQSMASANSTPPAALRNITSIASDAVAALKNGSRRDRPSTGGM